jgi:acetyl esterase/lipase
MIRKAISLGFLALLFLALGVATSFAAAPADDAIEFQRNVEYSNPNGEHLKLDLAAPKKIDGLAPAIVCIHGGGWAMGGKEPWDAACRVVAHQGYVAITVNYRLAPKYRFPAQLVDVRTAVRWLRANAARLKVDPDRIGAIGDSAGGHLSLMLGATGDEKQFDADADDDDDVENPNFSSRVQCIVDFYGPADLTLGDKLLPQVDQLLRNFVGVDREHGRRKYILASPFYWVTPDAAPTLLVHGTKDTLVPYQQSILMRDRLKTADVEAELLLIDGAGHGFRGADQKRAFAAAQAFFDKHLKNGKK